METPIPNFYFMGIQFLHLFALAFWVGGIVLLQAVVMPLLRSEPEDADSLMERIFLKFDRTTLLCAGALIATGIIKFWRWENLTPWNLIRYAAISVMSCLSLYTAIKISPKRLEAVSRPHSRASRESRIKLHRLSDHLMRINLACGAAALLMA